MLNYLAVSAAALLVSVQAKNPTCHVWLTDHHDRRSPQYNIGKHKYLGEWNNRATGFEIEGGDQCEIYAWDQENLSGATYYYWNGRHRVYKLTGQLRYMISSLQVYHRARRRRAEVTGDQFEMHEPLCEAVMAEGLVTGWQFTANRTIETNEIAKLRKFCNDEFSGDMIDGCLFYLHAIDEFFSSEELVKGLKFDESETLADEYQRCGILVNKLHEAIDNGDLKGVRRVSIDGKEYFEMDDGDDGDIEEYYEYSDHPLVQATSVPSMSVGLAFGSVLSALVGTKLVEVCKDFAADGQWKQL